MKMFIRWAPILLLTAAILACSSTFGVSGGLSATPTTTSLSFLPSTSGAGKSPDVNQGTLSAIYSRVSPGVVSIQVISNQALSNSTGDVYDGIASGFVYDTQGHILTNYHVVNDVTKIEVDFPSGYKAFAKVVGTDPDSDLAVLKVDGPAAEFVPIPLGDSNQLKVGETVVAIGNPLGFSGSMTVGIVSAKGRTGDSEHLTSGGMYYTEGDMIQTDAAINPGNSGGPLLNMAGEVVGITRALASTSLSLDGQPGSIGIGFAVPVNILKRVVPSLIQNGKYDYPYLGVSVLPEINLLEQEALGLPQSSGGYILSVVPGGPCDKAGILSGTTPTSIADLYAGGDLIIAVDGQPVIVFGDLLSYILENKSPGDTIRLTIIRDKQQKEVDVTLGKRP
jgi:S1-C subfamily serine protease